MIELILCGIALAISTICSVWFSSNKKLDHKKQIEKIKALPEIKNKIVVQKQKQETVTALNFLPAPRKSWECELSDMKTNWRQSVLLNPCKSLGRKPYRKTVHWAEPPVTPFNQRFFTPKTPPGKLTKADVAKIFGNDDRSCPSTIKRRR